LCLPILLNPQSSYAAYQPFKFGFLRILAVIGLAAWLVRSMNLALLISGSCAAALIGLLLVFEL
jgi:hypothetical protein